MRHWLWIHGERDTRPRRRRGSEFRSWLGSLSSQYGFTSIEGLTFPHRLDITDRPGLDQFQQFLSRRRDVLDCRVRFGPDKTARTGQGEFHVLESDGFIASQEFLGLRNGSLAVGVRIDLEEGD